MQGPAGQETADVLATKTLPNYPSHLKRRALLACIVHSSSLDAVAVTFTTTLPE